MINMYENRKNNQKRGTLMSNIGFQSGDILIPNQIDLEKWCVVACDQYTSEAKYWEDVSQTVKDVPSTFHIVFPEIYLNKGNSSQRILDINETMQSYLNQDLFYEYKNKFIYVERTLENGKVRCGLMGVVDLEEYDYHKGSQSLIRATEGTVLERIPPRVAIRENAPIEAPHIMLLIDDAQKSVIEPLENKKNTWEVAYETKLMKRGGAIKGYVVDASSEQEILHALGELAHLANFENRYQCQGKGVLLFAVGDGNHSLATAKQCYENLKTQLTPEQAKNHPARYALVEVVNLHSPALDFEPIHRVVFDVDVDDLIKHLKQYNQKGPVKEEAQSFEVVTGAGRQTITIQNPTAKMAVGTLQNFLDDYLKHHGGTIDYIHGGEVTIALGQEPGNVGFLLPPVDKSQLFPTVVFDGALPRKTFSMGHAWDKRYYLECRKMK